MSTKQKQVATVMARKGISQKKATKIVTRHRLRGEAIGGYTVTSKRAVSKRVRSGNGGPSTGGPKRTNMPSVNRNEFNRPATLAGSATPKSKRDLSPQRRAAAERGNATTAAARRRFVDHPINLPDQPKSYRRPTKGGGGRMRVS